jgi:hypothetical protein
VRDRVYFGKGVRAGSTFALQSEGRLYLGMRDSGFALPWQERVRLDFTLARESEGRLYLGTRLRLDCTLARECQGFAVP